MSSDYVLIEIGTPRATSANPCDATVIFSREVFLLRNRMYKEINLDFIVDLKVLRGRPLQSLHELV